MEEIDLTWQLFLLKKKQLWKKQVEEIGWKGAPVRHVNDQRMTL